jgi:hypothetical protein
MAGTSPANIDKGFDAASLRKVGTSIVGHQLLNRRAQIIIEDPSASLIAASDQQRELRERGRTTAKTVQHPVLIINEHSNDLRVRFSIKRDIYAVPQPCYVEVFDLSPENRRLLARKNFRVQVIAGYDPPQTNAERIGALERELGITTGFGNNRDPNAFLRREAAQPQARRPGLDHEARGR